MKIKEVAHSCGISSKSIRYYEQMGLLEIGRSDNGYREFNEEQVNRVKEICLFRSLQISVEDIKQYYEKEETLDVFLARQMVKHQERINELDDQKAYMLKLQHTLSSTTLLQAYEQRCVTQNKRSDAQEIELIYLSKTKRGKQWYIITIVWMLSLGFLFDFSMGASFEVFVWVAGVVLIVDILVSILLWFCLPSRQAFFKLFDLLGVIENFPNALDQKLERWISINWLRRIITLILLLSSFLVPVILIVCLLDFFF